MSPNAQHAYIVSAIRQKLAESNPSDCLMLIWFNTETGESRLIDSATQQARLIGAAELLLTVQEQNTKLTPVLDQILKQLFNLLGGFPHRRVEPSQ